MNSPFWPSPQNIDLRKEMHDILFGGADIVAQGRPLLLRELTDQPCPCANNLETGCAQPHCRYCDGEGYMFRERTLVGFMTRGAAPVYKPGFLANGAYPLEEWGYSDMDRATSFLEWNTLPNYERYTFRQEKKFDKLFELKANDDGSLFYPLTKTAKWKVLNVIPYHGDFGRIEFFELALSKENVA